MAWAAAAEPCGEREAASAAAWERIGSMGSTWPMTPVEATMTSSGATCRLSAAMPHIMRAFSSPSALQVLALPLLQMTAWAMPSRRFSRVTRIGAPFTRFCVYTAAAVQRVSQRIIARSAFVLFLRMPQWMPPAVNPFGAVTPPARNCVMKLPPCMMERP